MNKIHLFNPENDLALAANSPYYTPRAAAESLRRAGALLPMWWAEEGDLILVDDIGSITDKFNLLRQKYGLKGTPVTHVEDADCAAYQPDCWGWSIYTRRRLLNCGISPTVMPDNATLEQLRELSHRRTTIAIHRHINTPQSLLPVEAFSKEEAFEVIDRHGSAVIKLPWSSSSRGIIYSEDIPRDTLAVYLNGIARRHGSMLIEPRYNKIQDFAALFRSCNGKTIFEGLSIFTTDGKSRYRGNLVMAQSEMQKIIGLNLTDTITMIKDALDHVIAPHYSGWLGVDMLTYLSDKGTPAIAPCIEVNLRRTMGTAALEVYRHLPETMRQTPLLLSVDQLTSI